MYLKALEIQGFKSFPEKTRLSFEKDITAIVGPNGSGKSNISDAILWVMGEQRTRALRGGKMEDVIFGGTERRNALGFAQVSLIIDNTEGIFNTDNSEVMITRKYFRSGESEYFLNRQPARLRDITELLMDTGLGRYGYSIIGQGRISDIVSAKSADRREIFEEAAGISRFRYRKEESERKLMRTQENLLRINDKIDELELQVGPLRTQAETAKRYLLLRDELRVLEISLWLYNLDKLKEQAQTAETEYNSAKSELDGAHKELDDLYAQAENLSNRMRQCDIEADSARQMLSQAESGFGECESAAAVLRANIQNNDESADRYRKQQQEQDERGRELERQIDEKKQRDTGIIQEIEEQERYIGQVLDSVREERLSADSADAALKRILGEEASIINAFTENKTMLSMLEERSGELEGKKAEKLNEVAEAVENLAKAHARFVECEKGLLSSRAKTLELENAVSGHRIRLAGRQKKLDEISQSLTKQIIELKSMDSRISMLTDMEKELEGFSKAVRTVMREAGRGALRGIHGPVANLLRTGERYSLAIETALGTSAQSVVVDNPTAGKSAIELLKRQDAGRGTFLPLTTIRGRETGVLPVGERGYLGTALELSEFDERYREVFKNLLGRTIVAETLSDAISISEKHENRLRIVTLDGQLINPGGSMTGGSASKGSGILSRANELRHLEKERKVREERAAALESRHADARREMERAQYELDVSIAEHSDASEDTLRREALMSQADLLKNAASEAQIAEEAEILALEEQAFANAEKIRAAQESSRRLEAELSNIRSQIDEKAADRDEIRQKLESLSEHTVSARERISALKAEKEATEESIKQLEGLLRVHEGDSRDRAESLAELESRNELLRQELEQKMERISEFAARIQNIREQLAKTAEHRLCLEGERTKSEKTGQEKNRQLLDMERRCSRLEQRKLAFDMEEKQILDKLWDNYELSHSTAIQMRQELESIQKASRRISELRKEITTLGNPNIGAIEEFERVNSRYTFLAEQRDDVQASKRELEKIISDITSQMKDIFIKEFKAIDESFRKTFLELFGGGRASLLLEDEEDVLSCGIEIKVQPPGKALSTISLLSGGEMAFVAIALYFAILKVKPTPFCVMDEIEAALDEANVIRFAQYMRGISQKTQFIVITHRRGTMEEADMLYGVTMQEKGVSSVISVDLEGAERTIA